MSLYLFKSHLRCHLYFTAWCEPWSLLSLGGADEDPVFFVCLAIPTPLPSRTLMSPGWPASFHFTFCNSESGVSFSWWQLPWLPDKKALSPHLLSMLSENLCWASERPITLKIRTLGILRKLFRVLEVKSKAEQGLYLLKEKHVCSKEDLSE